MSQTCKRQHIDDESDATSRKALFQSEKPMNDEDFFVPGKS